MKKAFGCAATIMVVFGIFVCLPLRHVYAESSLVVVPTQPFPFEYRTHSSSNNVSVIDTATNTGPVGTAPLDAVDRVGVDSAAGGNLCHAASSTSEAFQVAQLPQCVPDGQPCVKGGTPCCNSTSTCSGKFPNTTCQ